MLVLNKTCSIKTYLNIKKKVLEEMSVLKMKYNIILLKLTFLRDQHCNM